MARFQAVTLFKFKPDIVPKWRSPSFQAWKMGSVSKYKLGIEHLKVEMNNSKLVFGHGTLFFRLEMRESVIWARYQAWTWKALQLEIVPWPYSKPEILPELHYILYATQSSLCLSVNTETHESSQWVSICWYITTCCYTTLTNIHDGGSVRWEGH